MTDDLDTPLGMASDQEKKRRWPALPLVPIAAGVVGAMILGIAGAIAVIHNPLGGEPRVITAIATAPPRSAEPAPQQAAAPQAAPAEEPGTTISIIDGMSGQSRQVRVAAPPPPEQTAGLDPRLAERTAQGVLPRVASDGSKARDVYARALRLPPGADPTRPRVALLIGGLGISQLSTSEALAKLPKSVSLAFAPYPDDLERMVSRARAEGYEVFLQVPMEPLDYPENDPGPKTLLTTLSAERNLERLHWSMGRFQGYAGIVNYMGGKFSASESALAPILREANRRGLMVVDDGTSARSLMTQIAAGMQQPAVRGDIHLDRVPTPAEIDAQLARLEARARETGFALGIGAALPVTIDRVARWARALESRGILLVPVTAGATRRPQAG